MQRLQEQAWKPRSVLQSIYFQGMFESVWWVTMVKEIDYNPVHNLVDTMAIASKCIWQSYQFYFYVSCILYDCCNLKKELMKTGAWHGTQSALIFHFQRIIEQANSWPCTAAPDAILTSIDKLSTWFLLSENLVTFKSIVWEMLELWP